MPTPTPGPPVTRAPLVLPPSILDLGPRAVVQVANLRVRSFIGTASAIQVQLGLGSELLLRLGPVTADGYDWYWAYYQPLIGEPALAEGGGLGWIAAGPGGPTYITIEPSRCPVVPMTAALLAAMSDIARTECLGTTAYQFTGVVETCYEGPYTPYLYEPEWLGFSCWFMYELGTSGEWLSMHMSPGVTLPETFARGDVIRVTGHVNDPAADDCRVVAQEPLDPAEIDRAQQLFVLSCRSAFAVTDIEVTGHINLPDPFGP